MLETILAVDGMQRKTSRHGAPSPITITKLHGALAIASIAVVSYLCAEMIFDRRSSQSWPMLVVAERPNIEMASPHDLRLQPVDPQYFAARQHKSHKGAQDLSEPSKRDALAISGTLLTNGAVKVRAMGQRTDPVVFFVVSVLFFALGYIGKAVWLRCQGLRSTYHGFEMMEQRLPPLMTSSAMAFTMGIKARHGVETHVDASPTTGGSSHAIADLPLDSLNPQSGACPAAACRGMSQ